MPFVTINGLDYPLATSLRVAYNVQGQHNHKPYSEVFSKIGEMKIEDQIGILYCAFTVGNPQEKTTKIEFLNYMLDNYKGMQIMELLKNVIGEIMGVDFDAVEVPEDKATAASEGN